MNVGLRAVVLPLFVGLASVFLIGCGGSEQNASAHNGQDVNFAQMMIPHHEQAVEMSRLVYERANREEVKQLARSIEAAQEPEINQMRSWLRAWGEGEMVGDHSTHDMPGMVGSGEMERLANVRGDEFDNLFLRLMISHHEGAIDMAKEVQSGGKSQDVERLAGEIIATQQAEIDHMSSLLPK